MEFRVLGPLEARTGCDELVVFGATKHKVLLALLLLNTDRAVPVDTIVEALWPQTAPRSALGLVRTYASQLRGALCLDGGRGSAVLVREPAGYRLTVRRDELDMLVFSDLADEGERALSAGDLALAAERLHGALALWRGPVVEGVPLDRTRIAQVTALEERRLAVQETWIATRLALGQHDGVIVDLRALVAAHPLRERFSELFMTALHRAGRGGDALAVHADVSRRLADELGVEPGPGLRRVHADVTAGARDCVPRQLPAALPHFTGRQRELAALDAQLDLAGRSRSVAICTVDGTAGVGKTTLAVHWAHRVADRFPDGQLYLNLRGFAPGGVPVRPAEAVRALLDALRVPPERVPATLDAQTALYRSLLADRRMLIVLDNALSTDQVRPLLPGSPTSFVLVTSRAWLAGLVAVEGARPLTLGLPTPAEAGDLLARRVGPARAAADRAAVDAIVHLAARLPLALAVVAARAAAHPRFPLTALADELRGKHGSLDGFAGGDLGTDVRAVFSWSQQHLTVPAARMFRLLGLVPGPDVTLPAAASLAGADPARVRRSLAELAAANLVEEHTPGRYTVHDLLRTYAAEQADRDEPPSDRAEALGRLLDHYLHTAHAAKKLLDPGADPVTPAPAGPSVQVPRIAGRADALRWFAAERQNLVAAVRCATDGDRYPQAWHLAWTLTTFLDNGGHWDELLTTQLAALAVARRAHDAGRQAFNHRRLSHALAQLGRHDEAESELREGLRLHRATGDDTGQAQTHLSIALILDWRGRHREALDEARQALDRFRSAGHRTGEGTALNMVGWCHTRLGEHADAVRYCRQALAVNQELGNRRHEAATWDSLGHALHHLGERAEASACFGRALELFRDVGDRYNEAGTLIHLGDTHYAEGDLDGARTVWELAATILEGLHHADAATVRGRLDALAAVAASSRNG